MSSTPSATRRDQMLASTGWLAAHLHDPHVRIVDCRFYFDDFDRGRRTYLESHIPGAQYLNWTTDISEPRGSLQFMAASPAKFTASMRRLGIDDHTTIVGYDDEGGHYVARLWLLLRRYGHENLRMLDGGWTKWVAEGRPTASGEEPAPAPGSFSITRERPEVLIEADDVLRLNQKPNAALLDVRRWSEFTGEEVRSKHGGRIPGATWLLWQDNLEWDGNRDFKPADAVRARYEQAGVTPDREVVTYCHGAVRAGHTAFTLHMLGYDSVRVYDGSWEEWGSRDDLPREQGAPPA